MNMPRKESHYESISLPTPLVEKVKAFIKKYPEYVNITDFIKSAVREKLENLGKKDVE